MRCCNSCERIVFWVTGIVFSSVTDFFGSVSYVPDHHRATVIVVLDSDQEFYGVIFALLVTSTIDVSHTELRLLSARDGCVLVL